MSLTFNIVLFLHKEETVLANTRLFPLGCLSILNFRVNVKLDYVKRFWIGRMVGYFKFLFQ